MVGSPADPGIIANTLRKIYRRTPEFEAIQRTDNPKLDFPYEYQVVDVTFSVLELCGDDIVDLLYDPLNHPDEEKPPKLVVKFTGGPSGRAEVCAAREPTRSYNRNHRPPVGPDLIHVDSFLTAMTMWDAVQQVGFIAIVSLTFGFHVPGSL